MTADLIAFLRARLDEELARAEAAAEEARSGDWRYRPGDDRVYAVDVRGDDTPGGPREDFFPLLTEAGSYVGDQISDSLGEFVAEHDPARVLREVEAKRRVLERYEAVAKEAVASDDYEDPERGQDAAVLLGVLHEMAAVYADHPDYREKWAP